MLSASIAPSCRPDNLPFRTAENYLTIWDGQQYQPFIIKGVNLGVGLPGTQPSQMAASRKDYIRWITQIREAGFNNIRVYTLHFPHFYEVLDSINLAHPNHPIHLFQGIWLEEELDGYHEDLYQLANIFEESILEVVDCIHGNRQISPRPGRAFGDYSTDVSRWIMGYIIGREVHPAEVLNTNKLNPSVSQYQGQAISLAHGSATEAFIARHLDLLIMHERTNYQTERPVSFSSWPTLDPLAHPTEIHTDEDIAHFDITLLDYSNAPAGIFATYHAYPYYPDFVSDDPDYQRYFDYFGQNSYLGYLIHLKEHYANMPLIIGEFGTASSWGIASYAHNGISHGGMDEIDQGLAHMRMLETLLGAGCGGGMIFSWLDEWFKRTWITDQFDFDPNRRILWHNITAAEQNFGLIGFQKPDPGFFALHEYYCDTCLIHTLSVKADYTFFHLKLGLQQPITHLDTLWIALDTYDSSLGESLLPNGRVVDNRAEFAIRITPHAAELYITQAYDLFGIWHDIAGPKQFFRSTPTDGAPWKLVRWKTNDPELDVHFIGQLKIRRQDQPSSSHDAVIIGPGQIHIRLPWSLLNFHDPSQLRVMHDYRHLPGRQDTLSDGILPMVFYRNFTLIPQNRFAWEPWNQVLDVEEREKLSLQVIRARLPFINNPPIGPCMHYSLPQNLPFMVDAGQGLLSAAIDLDGNPMQVLPGDYPLNGTLSIYPDGSFLYKPDKDFAGEDSFSYRIFDGRSLSQPSTVTLDVYSTVGLPEIQFAHIQVFPNPAGNHIYLNLPEDATPVVATLYRVSGQAAASWKLNQAHNTLNVSDLAPGAYMLRLSLKDQVRTFKVMIGAK